MKAHVHTMLVVVLGFVLVGCATSGFVSSAKKRPLGVSFMTPNAPIAIMPFESENALSNLGGQVSDEVIINLLDQAPDLKIIPATVVRNYLLNANVGIGGIPDMHSIHSLKDGLRCRYLLTGNVYTSIGEVRYTSSYTNRVASGSVTVRLVDCDSSTVVWARQVESTYSTTSYYSRVGQENLQTTYLTDGQLLQGLIMNLGYDVARSFYER